ncbi:MAG: DUF4397 domain-containing protein [Ktedonobacteraceae bacterium]|nr:DUF4397 domain-containing protein [Ktedonobacteraceae bacterium]
MRLYQSSLFYRCGLAGIASLLLMLFCVPMSASAASTSYVRVIHASPFIGIADVFVDGQKLLSTFQFAAVTDYVPVPPGAHKVQISLVGKGINASIVTQELTVAAGTTYTVAALGSDSNALSLQAFVDDNQVAPNKAKVRFYQLSPDAANIKVSIGDDATLQNTLYPKTSNYISVPSGPCDIGATIGQTSLPKLSLNLPANTVTSVFAVGKVTGNPQIRLVSARAQGLPNMPNTGSDPRPLEQPAQTSNWLPFLLAGCALLALLALPAYRYARAHRRP